MDSDLTGATLGHFRLVARVGAGRSATVYRAFAGHAAERQVAIKVLEPTLVADQAFRERFEKDVALAATLNSPHLLPVHAHGTDHGLTYIAMALAGGGSVRDLQQLGPVAPERAWPIATAVADALHRAHEAGLVHRDIKPSNILLDAGGRALLADFGLARTHLGFAVGTPEYMAPEQAMGGEADRRSDVYALAAILFELLTGRALRPRGGSAAEQLRAAVETVVPPPTQLMPNLPLYVDGVLMRALASDPSDRYQTAVDLIRDLGMALGMHAALPPPSGAEDGETGRRDGDAEFDRQRSQLLQVVHDSLAAAVALDESSFIVGWNEAAERTFGWKTEEIVGRLLSTTLIPPRHQEAHERGFQRYLQGGEGPVIGKVVELTAIHRAGHEFPIELSISPAVQCGSRALVVGFARDVGPEHRGRRARAARAALIERLPSAATLQDAGRLALEVIGGELAWTVGVLWLPHPDGQRLCCAHIWRDAGVTCPEFEAVTLEVGLLKGQGLPGRAWAIAEALWLEDVLHEPGEPRIVPALRAGLHGAVAIPIVAAHDVRGVLELLADRPRKEDDDLLLRLADLGRLVGRAGSARRPAPR